MNFQTWWEENKNGVCHDIVHHLKLDFNDEQTQLLLMHIVSQGWVAAMTYADNDFGNCRECDESLDCDGYCVEPDCFYHEYFQNMPNDFSN
jgi:hypothetical protein